MRTLVLGMGNPILGDDVVGILVAREVEERVGGGEVAVVEAGVGGLGLLDIIVGYDKVIIVDSINTGGRVGEVYRLSPEDFKAANHISSPHDVDFLTAIGLGTRLGLEMPREIVIIAIEIPQVSDFSEGYTPSVEGAIPVAVEMVIGELSV